MNALNLLDSNVDIGPTQIKYVKSPQLLLFNLLTFGKNGTDMCFIHVEPMYTFESSKFKAALFSVHIFI